MWDSSFGVLLGSGIKPLRIWPCLSRLLLSTLMSIKIVMKHDGLIKAATPNSWKRSLPSRPKSKCTGVSGAEALDMQVTLQTKQGPTHVFGDLRLRFIKS